MKHWRFLLLSSLISAAFSPARANDVLNTSEAVSLKEVKVKGKRYIAPNEAKIDRATIEEQMIRDSYDLVRYSTDVGISDNGRHNKGFAMRGVEGNRVGISIDSVALPDSEENSLYARYGNFNSSRLSIDPELVRGIDIVKGGDSFKMGSGALGGGVNYRTLEPSDIVLPNRQTGLLIKSGFGSRNREWAHTIGFATRTNQLETLAMYSQRRGHETKSAVRGDDVNGNARGIPDPAHHQYHSFLGKVKWHINDHHTLGASLNGQQGHNNTDEKSYNLLDSHWREADDINWRRNANLFYELTPESSWLALFKADVDYQKTKIGSINHKGSYPMDYSIWEYDYSKKELDEVFNRQMKTTFKRLRLRADSQPFTWGGTHRFSVQAFADKRHFENLNQDDYYLSGTISRIQNTIQHPVSTQHYGVSLQDSLSWQNGFSGLAGVRYDYYQIKPQALNTHCNNCQKEVPQASHFSGWSGVLGVNYQWNHAWKTGYNFTTGYRVPSASEMYFTYKHPAGNWLANPQLKPERSNNHTLFVQGKGSLGELDMSMYHNRYRNFLFEQQTAAQVLNPYYDSCYYYGCKKYNTTLYQQMVNIDKAHISGIDIQGRLNLDKAFHAPAGWKAMMGLGYSKGKLNSEASLLSIQPLKVILGLDYEAPSEKWGIFNRLTYLGAKKPKDAQEIRYEGWDYQRVVAAYPWLNQSAWVFDTFGFYKPNKNITLRAGVYNLFNRKYQTWDSLRGINRYSTTNAVDNAGKGLARFYAPGRNYAVSLEMKF